MLATDRILEVLLNYYVNDLTLINLLGNTKLKANHLRKTHVIAASKRVFVGEARPDSPMPYIVHALTVGSAQGHSVNKIGTYFIDVWTKGTKKQAALKLSSIIERIQQMLNNIHYGEDVKTEIANLYVFMDSYFEIGTNEKNVKHGRLIYRIKYQDFNVQKNNLIGSC